MPRLAPSWITRIRPIRMHSSPGLADGYSTSTARMLAVTPTAISMRGSRSRENVTVGQGQSPRWASAAIANQRPMLRSNARRKARRRLNVRSMVIFRTTRCRRRLVVRERGSSRCSSQEFRTPPVASDGFSCVSRTAFGALPLVGKFTQSVSAYRANPAVRGADCAEICSTPTVEDGNTTAKEQEHRPLEGIQTRVGPMAGRSR